MTSATVAADRNRLDPTAIVLALVGAFLYSWKPVFVKLLYAEGVDGGGQLMLRFAISIPLYAVIGAVAYRDRIRRRLPMDLGTRTVLSTIGAGIIGYYIAAYTDILALAHITAQFERLVLFTYPTFVVIAGHLFFRERLTPALIGSLAASYAGLALIFIKDFDSFGPQVVHGTLLALTSAVAYALYLLLSKPLIARMGSQLFTALSMLAGSSLIILQFFATSSLADIPLSWTVVWLALGIAFIATVLPSFLVAEAIARIGPAPTSVIGGTGPIITALLAIWLLGEPFTLWHLCGMMLVIGGILLLSRSRA